MRQISVHEAKAHFSAIMKEVEAGEVIVVTRHDKPIMEMRSLVGLPIPELGAFADPNAPALEINWSEQELNELFGFDSSTEEAGNQTPA